MRKVFYSDISIMKKKIILSFVLFISIAFSALASSAERNFLGLQFSLGSGFPFYGDSALYRNNNRLNEKHYNRFILCGDFGLTGKLTDNLFVVVGMDSVFDFNWNDSFYSNYIDYAYLLGIQVYPGWGNLSFTLSYALGHRADFIKQEENFETISTSSWGNGFKFAVEYDFLSGGGFIPAIGASWRFMPRGRDNYDNNISVYLRFAFR